MNESLVCPFCVEATGVSDPRFESMYKGFSTRQIARQGHVFSIPTLGQLFLGSVMIVSCRHVERFSDAQDLHGDALSLFHRLEAELEDFGECIVYEHGALSAKSGGCGIYHAHMHVVPLPDVPVVSELTGLVGLRAEGIKDAWRAARSGVDYLLVHTKRETQVIHSDVGFGSQFMRKKLVERYRVDRDWDWKSYTTAEPDVVSTLAKFGVP